MTSYIFLSFTTCMVAFVVSFLFTFLVITCFKEAAKQIPSFHVSSQTSRCLFSCLLPPLRHTPQMLFSLSVYFFFPHQTLSVSGRYETLLHSCHFSSLNLGLFSKYFACLTPTPLFPSLNLRLLRLFTQRSPSRPRTPLLPPLDLPLSSELFSS